MINTLSGASDESNALKRFIVKFHLLMASYVQSIDMIRWYAIYKNGERYNKESYFSMMEAISRYFKNRNVLRKQVVKL